MEMYEDAPDSGLDGKTKAMIAGGVLLALAIIIGIGYGLFRLGGADQSSLERLRDIAIIFIVLLGTITVVLLAGVVAALTFLVFQTKDRVIPLIDETTLTMKRARGTVEFMSEEAVRPVVAVAGRAARIRAMTSAVMGRNGIRR
jgi:hypothetical protein